MHESDAACILGVPIFLKEPQLTQDSHLAQIICLPTIKQNRHQIRLALMYTDFSSKTASKVHNEQLY